MKTTAYFRYMRMRPDRRGISEEWIKQTIAHPDAVAQQADGRIRRWRWIPEAGKWLRVILLEDGETLHNAFFDRRFVHTAKASPKENRT